MDQNSEKDNYVLAPVEDEEFLLTDPENPLTSPPHEETTDGDARPKRTIKPTLKLLENRFNSDKEKLEKMWVDTAAAISKLRQTPDSVDKIRSAISELRSIFGKYQLVWVSLMDFTSRSNAPECQRERKTVEEMMKTCRELIQGASNEGIDRKNDILQEVQSARSGSSGVSHVSTVSSTAIRAQARAEAVAAQKKAEMERKMAEIEAQSALLLEQEEKRKREEEMAFARKKRKEEVWIACLCLEQEAAVALAKANAMDEELAPTSAKESQKPDLPLMDLSQRVRDFIKAQMDEESTRGTRPDANLVEEQTTDEKLNPEATQHVKSTFKGELTTPKKSNPKVTEFIPIQTESTVSPTCKPLNHVESYIQFMARQELVANKIEKFDNRPENYRTWKASFENMVRDVNITASETLTLLIEYTTSQSKRLVQRLRNAYVENPEEGLKEAWKKLSERFGSNALVTQMHLNKLTMFPKIEPKDNKGLQELGDLLLELECAKNDGGLSGLKVLDEPAFLKPLLVKLPDDLQGTWQRHAYRYKVQKVADYPSFSEFAKFIQEISQERNDPYLAIENLDKRNLRSPKIPFKPPKPPNTGEGFTVRKTELSKCALNSSGQPPSAPDTRKCCFIHRSHHALSKCRVFRSKTLDERKNLLSQHGVCFRCVASSNHHAKNCTAVIKCSECQSDKHTSALHPGSPNNPVTRSKEQGDTQLHGEEASNFTTTCTEMCGSISGSKSCSKICLANVYSRDHPGNKIKAYAIIDDQSNCSLGTSRLFELLNLGGDSTQYTLRTCSGMTQAKGRRAMDLVIESVDGSKHHNLPPIIECDAIPNNRDEIPIPESAGFHPHLRGIAHKIPNIDMEADILLLIGRDAPPLHKVHESRNGTRDAPWAQRLDLGWVVIGNACLNGAHRPSKIATFKTHFLDNGRPSFMEPCPSLLYVKCETTLDGTPSATNRKKGQFINERFEDSLGTNVFVRTRDDNKPGTSIEDRKFLKIMDEGMVKDQESGSWAAPLPLREETQHLPDNRENALKRMKSTRRLLDKKPTMKEHYFTFMQKLLDSSHAEIAPVTGPNQPTSGDISRISACTTRRSQGRSGWSSIPQLRQKKCP